MTTQRRAFVIMPFGKKKLADGTEVDCDQVYKDLLCPAIEAAGFDPHRADADRRGGSIHADMFQDLLLAEFVVADLTMDNPNVWYEIGVRQALRAGGAVLTGARTDKMPFDLAGQRMHRYTLVAGKLDATRLADERESLTKAIEETRDAWRGRRISPVYQTLPNLKEPDWKTIKVGEFWEGLQAWQRRVDIALKEKQPGNILVLADEMPNSVLEFDALRIAADALMKLGHPRYALDIIERALKLAPDDAKALQIEGMALGRLGRYAEASVKLRGLAESHRDGETLGLVARTAKDEWTQQWKQHPLHRTTPLEAAADTAETLELAVAAYVDAFKAEPANYYPGINVVTLARLWEHVTGKSCQLGVPFDVLAAGVAWAITVADSDRRSYWPLASLGDLALVQGRKADAIDAYRKAAARAVAASDRFALDSTRQQLDFLLSLDFHADIAGDAIGVLERSLTVLGVAPRNTAPSRVVVFSGHMVDNPAKRGPGKELPARFPESKANAAALAIRQRLDRINAAAGDLGVCGGASGGDLLFAEACLERDMKVELRLAREIPQFLSESVTFADPTRRWEGAFDRVTNDPRTRVRIMPEQLGPAPEGVSVHDRCNRWILYSALSNGVSKASCIALWDGAPGDGPGGTQHMVDLVKRLTGVPPEIIDPATL